MDSVIKNYASSFLSEYSLLTLGKDTNGNEVKMSEEERYVNFHILGAPGEGKSKFLECHIRKDIDMGNGLCLLDPSDKGDTAHNILNYCASINHEKVILIDPATISKYKKIPCIAPLKAAHLNTSVDGVMEALAILFKGDYATMRRIRRYLSALLRIIARQGLTLKETRNFSSWHWDTNERNAILGDDRDSYTIGNLLRSEPRFEEKFSSTVNMLDVLWRDPLWEILGNSEGIDFKRAVADGWVILVNLSPYYLTDEQSELLGVIIISQIIQAVDILANNTWKGVFYLYIDEVGSFATPQIKTLLQKKRKSGLRLYLAHHDYAQFKGKEEVMSAIENSARIKLMFNTPGYDDRMKMIKALGYGGDIPPVMASYANSDLPKQHAILKKNKEPPVRIKIPDVKDAPKASEEYINKILSQSFYKDARSIPANNPSPQSRKVDESEADSQAALPRPIPGKPEKGIRPDHKKSPEPPKKRPIKI